MIHHAGLMCVWFLVLPGLWWSVQGQGQCTGQSPCHCQFDNGQYMDFAALGSRDGTPT